MDFSPFIQQMAEDKLLVLAFPVFILVMLLEMYIDRREQLNLYYGKDTWVSLSMAIAASVIEFIPKLMFFVLFYLLHEISPLRDVVERQWWAWTFLFFADDFTYYWFHRLNHEVRLFWAGHVPHHSSIHMNFGTALRQGVGERVHKYLFWIWLPLLGFDPLMIFMMISLNLLYQFWVHTELVDKLPKPVEAIMNTPSHHRVHHASNIRYLDCNHAGVLIIWDRLFGTFSPEIPEEKVVYGLTKNIETYNPAKVATHEYTAIFRDVRRAKNWGDKLRYIFLAPGWSHDGEDKRAKTLRRKAGVEL